MTVTNVVVGSATSLTANFVLDCGRRAGARTVTVTTAGGTSGGQTFTINLPAPGAPTLTSVAPNQGTQGATVAVTLTGTNFVVGATTVTVSGAGVTVNTVVVGSTTSLTANFVLDPAAAVGARTVTVTTAGGTSGAQTFTINLPAPGAPTLTSVAPNQGIQGTTVAVTLTGTNFVVGATTVNVSGAGVTVNTVVVGSTTSLTANFVLDPAAAAGPRTVTVTTAGGTSGAQTFTINLPPGADADQRLAESRHPGHHGGGHADRHQFRRRRHDGGRQRWRRDGQQRRRGQQHIADRQLRARSGRRRWCPHGDGHDRRRHKRRANLHDQSAGAVPSVRLTGGPQTFTVPAGRDDADGDRAGCTGRNGRAGKAAMRWNRDGDADRRPG